MMYYYISIIAAVRLVRLSEPTTSWPSARQLFRLGWSLDVWLIVLSSTLPLVERDVHARISVAVASQAEPRGAQPGHQLESGRGQV